MANLFILLLAAWRLSLLLSSESGPAALLDKLRHKAGVRYDDYSIPYGTNWLSKGILCARCNSMWIGIVLSSLYIIDFRLCIYLCLPFALSSISLIMEIIYGKKE